MVWKFQKANSACKYCRDIDKNKLAVSKFNLTSTIPNNSAKVKHTGVSLKPSAFETEIGVVIFAFW